MMQSELFQSSWPGLTVINHSFDDQVGFYGFESFDIDVCEFSTSFTTTDDVSDISSVNAPSFSAMFSGLEVEQSPCGSDDGSQALVPLEDYLLDFEDFPSQDLSNGGWSPSPSVKSTETSMEMNANPSSTFALTQEGAEFDNQTRIYHLLQAYAEAMESGHKELADVIMISLREKVSPTGETLERIGFYLCQDLDKQGDYLRQESMKNIEAAFLAIYQILPDGRCAHFSENASILEAIPADAGGVHIVDFDMGEGIQWPPLMEALSQLQKSVRLTSIKWEKGHNWSPIWSFEETKRRLVDHGRNFGLKMKVEEMRIDELVNEVKRRQKRGGRKEFLAFNCNVSLLHMGRVKSKKQVIEFMRVAKDLMVTNKGIITIANGDSTENSKDCSDFGSFFNAKLANYQALLESIESNFPAHLREARTAVESVFVAPYVSAEGWCKKWGEMREGCSVENGGLEGWRVSRESVEEAKEMVKEKERSYGVRVGGHFQNEMILEWKSNPLVTISSWKN